MPYRYYQILSFHLPAGSSRDVEKKLYEMGCLGVETSPSGDGGLKVRAYFSEGPLTQQLSEKITHHFIGIQEIRPTVIGLPELRDSSPSFSPFPLLENLWVVPPYQAEGELRRHADRILLQPGMAFGSGRHRTTRISAALMHGLSFRPASLLDVGTGSGILAILAKRLGVPKVEAVEILAEARKNAKKNFRLNACPEIPLHVTMDLVKGSFEVVVANMLAPTLVHLKEQLLGHLEQGGTLILSGITLEEETLILESFSGLTLQDRRAEGEWVGLVLVQGINRF